VSGTAITGVLAMHWGANDALGVETVVTELADICHGKLVRQLMKSDVDPDIVAAHVVHGLAVGTLKAAETKQIELTCFLPKPLSGRQVAALLRKKDKIPLATPGAAVDPDIVAFVDDGTEVAKVLRKLLVGRLIAYVPPKRPSPPPPAPTPPPRPASPPVSERRPAAPAPAPAPKKSKPPHVLRPLADALGARVGELGIRSFQYVIDEELDEPIVTFGHGQVRLAGENRQLRAIAASMREDRAAIQPALDALAAHTISILNISFTDITDASELFALAALLSRPSGGPPRSRRSS
jgi:hypothetical protein